MTITLNDIPHTVLPFLANWDAALPNFTLSWDTEIAQSLRGYESRGTYRANPRPRLEFAVDVDNAGTMLNLLRLVFHVDHTTAHIPGATAGTARVAVPWAGRESWLQAWTDTTLTIEPTPWPWAVGDWLIVLDEADHYAVRQLAAVEGNVLTLSASLSLNPELSTLNYLAPLFFGRMDAPSIDLQSPAHGDVMLAVTGDRYVIAPGIPPACLDEPEWPDPPTATGPTALGSAEVMEMSASFDGTASTAGTHPKDGVTTVPLVGYAWDFGDGELAVGSTCEHEFTAAGVYNVVLTVTDGLSRFDTVIVPVTIDEPVDGGSSGEVGGGEI